MASGSSLSQRRISGHTCPERIFPGPVIPGFALVLPGGPAAPPRMPAASAAAERNAPASYLPGLSMHPGEAMAASAALASRESCVRGLRGLRRQRSSRRAHLTAPHARPLCSRRSAGVCGRQYCFFTLGPSLVFSFSLKEGWK